MPGTGLLGFGLLGLLLPGADGFPGMGPGVDVLGTTVVDVPVETLTAGSCAAEAEAAEYDADAASAAHRASAPPARKASFVGFFRGPP